MPAIPGTLSSDMFNRIRKLFPKPATTKFQEPPASLTTLPAEVLTKIMEDVGWEGILVLRECSRHLARVSKLRSLWLDIFRRSCGTTIPLPFFLPKPVDLCTAEDLEDIVVGFWTRRRHLPGQLREPRELVFGPPPHSVREFEDLGFLPGDRFLLYYSKVDGAIYYCHVEHPEHGGMFIPSAFENPANASAESKAEVRIAFDCFGVQDIEATDRSSGDLYFPPRFNMALVRWRSGGEGPFIEVWEVAPEGRALDGRVQGFKTRKLASLRADYPDSHISAPSLYKNHLAYSLVKTGAVTVLDWTLGFSQDADSYRRIHVRVGFDPRKIVLLPSKRFLAVSQSGIGVWDWSKTRPLTTAVIAQSTTNEGDVDFPRIRPIAKKRFDKYLFDCMPVYFIRDSIRMVVAHSESIFGVVIPLSPSSERLKIRIVSLVEETPTDPESILTTESLGYNKGVITDEDANYWVGYPWPDEKSEDREVAVVELLPHDENLNDKIYFSETMDRVIAFDSGKTAFYVYDL
ncbi:hypothetical protein CC2G_000189 [Coprinopsis cinerea AmutBmut pab1-1]|nr:hypothetical protein CC2G_000189 [Coprinopsis cinerea AmutBmut pab1-1]